MQTSSFGVHISLLGLLVTGNVGAVHESVIAVFIDMRLYMAPRNNLTASSVGVWTPHTYIVTHIDEQARHVHEDSHGGRTAGWTDEVFGRAGARLDGGIEAFLAKDMIALQPYWSNKRAVAYRTH